MILNSANASVRVGQTTVRDKEVRWDGKGRRIVSTIDEKERGKTYPLQVRQDPDHFLSAASLGSGVLLEKLCGRGSHCRVAQSVVVADAELVAAAATGYQAVGLS